MNSYYTGIGSRTVPEGILDLITKISIKLNNEGLTLRSGHAPGSDRAFEIGADSLSDIYIPWKGFGIKKYKDDPGMRVLGRTIIADHDILREKYQWLISIGAALPDLKDSTQFLLGRDVLQVEGLNEEPRSLFILCYTPELDNGMDWVGGTRYACWTARYYNILIHNLWKSEIEHKLRIWLDSSSSLSQKLLMR